MHVLFSVTFFFAATLLMYHSAKVIRLYMLSKKNDGYFLAGEHKSQLVIWLSLILFVVYFVLENNHSHLVIIVLPLATIMLLYGNNLSKYKNKN